MKITFNIQKSFLVLMICFPALLFGQTVTLESNTDMNMDGLYFWYPDPKAPVYLFNANITPKDDCFDIVNGYAFLTWYKGGMNARNLMLSRLKLGTNNWVTIEFPETNTLYNTVYNGIDYSKSNGGDSHRTTSIGISGKDGTVHLVFDQHTQDLNYRVSKKDIAFAPDDQFVLANFLPKQNYFKVGEPIVSCTYPNFITNAAGELILNFRIGTSRQGDMMGAYYDGNTWSSLYTIVKGNNATPEFNHYGDLYYYNNTLYFCGSIRVKDSPTVYNQGVYFGQSAGQHGNENWKNIAGNLYPIPIADLMSPFKIAEPLPTPTSSMTSSANLVVSSDGSLHFSGQVSGVGYFHYYNSPGGTTLTKASSPATINFAAGDRIYSLRSVVSTGRFVISSSEQNNNNWRDDFSYFPPNKFANMVSKYYDGKLYMVASEYKESDKHPFRFLTFDLGIKNTSVKRQLDKNKINMIYKQKGTSLSLEWEYSKPVDVLMYNAVGQLIAQEKGGIK